MIRLIVNERASKFDGNALSGIVAALGGPAAVTLEYVGRPNASERSNCRAVVVYGGDGTVHHAMQQFALGPQPLPIGIIPGGYANVISRRFGRPRDPVTTAHALTMALRSESYETVPLATVNGTYFTIAAGIGIDAEIMKGSTTRRAPGSAVSSFAYLRSAGLAYRKLRRDAHLIEYSVDGGPTLQCRSIIVQRMWPLTYLAGVPLSLAPTADVTDDQLGVCAVNGFGFVETGLAATRLFTGARSTLSAGVKTSKGWRICVTNSAPIGLQADGEWLGECTTATIAASEKTLQLVRTD